MLLLVCGIITLVIGVFSIVRPEMAMNDRAQEELKKSSEEEASKKLRKMKIIGVAFIIIGIFFCLIGLEVF